MKALSFVRSTLLRFAVAALVLIAGCAAFVSASSLPKSGQTGNALALRAMSHPNFAKSIFQNGDAFRLAAGRQPVDLASLRASALRPLRGPHADATTNPAVVIPDPGVQTFDVFAPKGNDFVPADGALTPTSLTPIYTSNGKTIIFASNLAGDGHTHLFAISASGDVSGQASSIQQITTGDGDEAFPTLSVDNTKLAFTSTAGNGTSNLYEISFNLSAFSGTADAINVGTGLTSLTIRPDLTSGTGFGAVGRPTFSPDGSEIAFTAVDSTGANTGVPHIWFLYTATKGFDQTVLTDPPAKLTSGPAHDTDPAWSPDGNYIAFASTATSIMTNPAGTTVGPGTSPTVTTGSQTVRNLFLISGGTTESRSVFGSVPTSSASAFDGHVTASTTVDDFGPAWSFLSTANSNLVATATTQYLNRSGIYEYLSWARGSAQGTPHNIDYLRLTEINNANQAVITSEGQTTPAGFVNNSIVLNTDDNAGETSVAGNVYNDVYPAWAPFQQVLTISYSSNRSVTYNQPTTNVPLEVALSLAPGTNGVGAAYSGILQSQVINLDPPQLLAFGGGNVVQITNPSGVVTRNIQPGQVATFTVRLSDREAGIDPNNVYVQIKDPNSKYQDAQNLEHKVYTRDNTAYGQDSDTSGSAEALLFNGGLGIGMNNAGYNVINNLDIPQRGAVAGVDGSDTISVGTFTGTAPQTFNITPTPVDDTQYIPFGQEYECQVINPMVANPDTNTGDFTKPYYLAGIDDAFAFSGSTHAARPTVNTAATTGANPTPATYAQWIKLSPATPLVGGKLVPDVNGGVLFTGTYTTPTAFGSDFYMDVIAYDNAVFPALPLDTSPGFSGQKANWRIYDNVGGFTTATFDGGNDVLVVSDNTLGQKFAGADGDTNLVPTFYGAESYYTDIDVSLLPNSVYFNSAPMTSPTAPNVPAPIGQATPSSLSATPGNALVTLVWTGITPAPSGGYNIYRAPETNSPTNAITAFGGATSPNFLANVSGTAATTFVDRTVTNGQTYFYEVTAVNGTNNESAPSNEASTTPFVPGTNPVAQVQGLDPSVGLVLNGLGVGSYDDVRIDDGRTVDGRSDVQSQRYSIWRILSRGPLPASVLQAYSPTFTAQPAVADPVTGLVAAAANGTTAPLVAVANRCVVWASPFTGDLLVGAGTISDASTQAMLTAFVHGGTIGTTTFAGGGRLFVSGQDVGSYITHNGEVDNTVATNAFLPGVLNATLASFDGGSQVLVGGAASGNRISYDAFFNANSTIGVVQNFLVLNSNLLLTYLAPAQSPVFELGNDYFKSTTPLLERTDGSLDQIGPLIYDIGQNVVQGQIDTLTAQNGAHTDITFAGGGSGTGLVYNEDATDGSRTVYASFGLEGLGIEYYKITDPGGKNHYSPRNLRPNILHNVVCYLRTGTFSGSIRQSGQGGAAVSGATVYLLANQGVAIPGSPTNRQLYSAISDSNGNYTISGVEPGAYEVVAYKTGFNRATSASGKVSYDVEGDSATVVNLNINPLPPGVITGRVTTGTAGVANALVKFVSTDGQTTLTATTDSSGDYTIINVPQASYNGTASELPAYGTAAPTQGNPIAVTSGNTTTANFVLAAAPGTVTGTVKDSVSGAGIVGATVTFTPTNGAAAVVATTTTGGAYTASLPSTGYTAVASAKLYTSSTAIAFTVTPGAALTENFILTLAPKPVPGTLGGLVTDAVSGTAIAGATVTLTTSAGAAVTDINGNTVAPATTTGTTTSPTAPNGDGSPLNYSFANLPAGTYTVTVTDGGYGTQTLSTLTVTAGAFTRADFTAANGNPLEPIHVFPGGQFSFFSLPTDYSGGGVAFVNSLFGPLNLGTFSPLALSPANANRSHLYVYNPTLLQYITDPTPPADGLHIGQGYWVYLVKASELTSVGASPTTATVPVALARGWNMIGVPSTSAITVSRLTFANATGGGAVSFSDATSSAYHLILPTLYGFDGTEYNTVTATSSLQPYQAYWIYAYAATTVLIPTTGG